MNTALIADNGDNHDSVMGYLSRLNPLGSAPIHVPMGQGFESGVGSAIIPASAGRIAGVIALSGLAVALAKHGVRGLEDMKRRPTEVTRSMGAAGLPIRKIEGEGAAYYMPPFFARMGNAWDRISGAELPKDHDRSSRHGYVSVTPDLWKPAIIAHEVGHAAVSKGGGLSQLNQDVLRPVTSIPGGILASLASLRAGVMEAANPQFKGRPWAAGAAAALPSAALGVLGQLPTLVSEWQATSKAKDWLNSRKDMSEDEKKSSRGALNKALGTYLVSAMAGPALMGGLTAGILTNGVGK